MERANAELRPVVAADAKPDRYFRAWLPARTQLMRPSIGDFSIHHLAPELFGGYVPTGEGGHLALPEKALFDTIYLLTPRGGQIRLPELELPDSFDQRRLDEWTQRIPGSRLRTMVQRALAAALRGVARPSGEQMVAERRITPAKSRLADLPPPAKASVGATDTDRDPAQDA